MKIIVYNQSYYREVQITYKSVSIYEKLKKLNYHLNPVILLSSNSEVINALLYKISF